MATPSTNRYDSDWAAIEAAKDFPEAWVFEDLEAGVWKHVEVKAFNGKAWIPFADVPYTSAQNILRRTR